MTGIPFLQQLRYGLAGAAVLISFWAACPDCVRILHGANELLDAAVLLALSLVLGSLVYAVHRAVLHPVVYRIFLIGFCTARRYDWSWSMLLPWPSRLELGVAQGSPSQLHGQIGAAGMELRPRGGGGVLSDGAVVQDHHDAGVVGHVHYLLHNGKRGALAVDLKANLLAVVGAERTESIKRFTYLLDGLFTRHIFMEIVRLNFNA